MGYIRIQFTWSKNFSFGHGIDELVMPNIISAGAEWPRTQKWVSNRRFLQRRHCGRQGQHGREDQGGR